MDQDLLKAYNYGNYSRTIKNQIELLKMDVKKRLRYAFNGGIFEITPEFIIHIKSYYDQGIYRAVFLDINENPIMVEDIEKFFETIIQTEREVLNWYYLELEKIRQIRNTMDLLK